MKKDNLKFRPDIVFHVYTHSNGDENIFREDENYRFFLRRYAKYIVPVARTYAFCLMPNHFHLMIAVRSKDNLINYFTEQGKSIRYDKPDQDLSRLITRQFGNLLNSYTKSFNKMYDRKGKLFYRTLKAIAVESKNYYKQLIIYIHQNPITHGFVNEVAEWPYSSYHLVISGKKTRINRKEVLSLFNGKDTFIQLHKNPIKIDKDILLEA